MKYYSGKLFSKDQEGVIPPILLDGNTVAWYDYLNSESIIKDGSNRVSQWKDILLSGHDLIQATSGLQPLLTSEGIVTDGVDNYMQTGSFAYGTPLTVYLVVNPLTWSLYGNIIDGKSVGSLLIRQQPTANNIFFFNCTDSPDSSIRELALNQFSIIRYRLEVVVGSPGSIQVNDLPRTYHAGSSDTPNGITISTLGSPNEGIQMGNILYKGMIFRQGVDTLENAEIIYNYLKTKYGI